MIHKILWCVGVGTCIAALCYTSYDYGRKEAAHKHEREMFELELKFGREQWELIKKLKRQE